MNDQNKTEVVNDNPETVADRAEFMLRRTDAMSQKNIYQLHRASRRATHRRAASLALLSVKGKLEGVKYKFHSRRVQVCSALLALIGQECLRRNIGGAPYRAV